MFFRLNKGVGSYPCHWDISSIADANPSAGKTFIAALKEFGLPDVCLIIALSNTVFIL